MKFRSIMAVIATAALCLLTAPAAEALYGGTGFLEVNDRGEMVYWNRSGTTYARVDTTSGGDQMRLISGMGKDIGLAVTNDDDLLYCDRACRLIGPGWGTARLLTALSPTAFLEVRADGDLVRWTWNGTAWVSARVGTDWGTARIVAGLDGSTFLEVKTDGTLARWTWSGNALNQQIIGVGWGNARLLAGVNSTRFVQVRDDGALIEWNAAGNTYAPTQVGQGWQTARLLG